MIVQIIVGLISGFLGAIGVGGGSVLVLYLSLFQTMPQLKAQGINLLFFIPCSAVGIAFHIKNKLIDYRKALPLILFGFAGVWTGFFLSRHMDDFMIRKIFGAFLFVLAGFQIINTLKEKKSRDNN